MNQVALNLIAIGVFSITLSSLVGPIFHLSPFIPAIATFSILSLATLDSFNFQGKGGTLIIGTLAQLSPEYRDRILHHEAGHFLAAYLLQIPITGYSLSPWEALKQGQFGQGGVSFADPDLNQELQAGQISSQRLDRYCTVWMAGIAAERLMYGIDQGGADDREKLRILWIEQLKRPVSESEFKTRQAILQARTLLETHWSAYQSLVQLMAKNTSIADCYQAIATTLSPD